MPRIHPALITHIIPMAPRMLSKLTATLLAADTLTLSSSAEPSDFANLESVFRDLVNSSEI